ncbi:hypothetical protein HDV63DRAFT_369134 [Trichoderma sp. SZMC 28014]
MPCRNSRSFSSSSNAGRDASSLAKSHVAPHVGTASFDGHHRCFAHCLKAKTGAGTHPPLRQSERLAWGGQSRFELQQPDCRLYGHRTAQSSYLKRTSTALRSCTLVWGSRRFRRWVAWPVSTLIEHRKPALHQGGSQSQIPFQAQVARNLFPAVRPFGASPGHAVESAR